MDTMLVELLVEYYRAGRAHDDYVERHMDDPDLPESDDTFYDLMISSTNVQNYLLDNISDLLPDYVTAVQQELEK